MKFSILFKYFARNWLLSFLILLAAVLLIILFLDTVELLRRASHRTNVPIRIVLEMALLKLPNTGQKAIPFIALFSSMHTLWKMTRSHELTIAKASGISIWGILTPMLIVACTIGIIMTTLVNHAAATFTRKYDALNTSIFQSRSFGLDISQSGLWLRQPYEDGHILIHAKSLDNKTFSFQDVSLYFFQKGDAFEGTIEAKKAILDNGYWKLDGATMNIKDYVNKKVGTYELPTSLTIKRIKESSAPPESVSFWKLPSFISAIESTGLSGLRYRFHFQSLLAQPLLLVAMVLIAAAFAPRDTRSHGGITAIVASMIAGAAIFIVKDAAAAFGTSGEVPILLAAWVPAIASTLLGLAALIHREEV